MRVLVQVQDFRILGLGFRTLLVYDSMRVAGLKGLEVQGFWRVGFRAFPPCGV